MSLPEAEEHEPNANLCLPLPRLAEISFAGPKTALPLLTDEALHAACGTRVCFTSRLGGVSEQPYDALNLATHVEGDEEAVKANRRTLLECTGAAAVADKLIVPKQVHGDEVCVVDDVETTRTHAEAGADGIVCTRAGVPVLLCFADCTPVVMVAPGGAFCIVHAGWRGALAGIAGKGLALLAREAGCAPAACNVYIGPHIGSCCYEVSEELLAQFVEAYGQACDAGRRHLDLSAAVTASVLHAGAAPERITDADICTACNTQRYYSYRAEGGVTGRHGAFAFKEAMIWD